MRIKLIAGLLLGFFVFLSIPTALAADLPMLTWERGKEQNVVLKGVAAQQNWDLEFVSKTEKTLQFHKSEKNSKGDVVYSVSIPESYATGLYIIQTVADSRADSRTLSGVTVLPLQTANLIQIPIKLSLIHI